MSLPLLIVILGIGILVLVFLAVALLRGTRSGREKNRDSQAVIRSASRTLAQNPRDVDALSALGAVYFSDQNWEQATTVYSKLMDLVATNPELDEPFILMRHGLAAMQMKRYQDAYRSLILASRELKDVFEINFNLGRLEIKRKNYERAAALLRSAHSMRPEHTASSRQLGQALFRIKRFSEAIGILRRVVQAEPDDKESLFFLGQSYYELGQLDSAGRIFRQLRTDPTYGSRAALIAGSVHLKNRLYSEAEIDFQIGLKHENINPGVSLELKYRLAATYTRMQEIDKSLELLTQIASINPAYKDVAQQIERGRELAGNKNLQIYLMGSTPEFIRLCRRIVGRYYQDSTVKVTDISVNRTESADVLADVHTPKWEDTALFRFMRTTGQTGELVVRDLQSRMKDLHAPRGLCISAGPFSEGAKEYVEARFIDLVEKEEFLRILRRS